MTKTDNIYNTVQSSDKGTIFFVSDFATNGNDVFISRVLSELVEKGELNRLSNGIYYKPTYTKFGVLMPSVDQIVIAIARRDNAKILPSGNTAMNMLGLSTQVPMKYIYLTSGSARVINIGNKEIIFKRGVPKNFAYQGKLMPIIVQALKEIGKDNVTDEHRLQIAEIMKKYPETDTFNEDINLAPIWIKKMISLILKEINNE